MRRAVLLLFCLVVAAPMAPANAPENWLLGKWSRSSSLCATLFLTFGPRQIVETVIFRGQVRRTITRGVTYRVIGPGEIEINLPAKVGAGPGPRFEGATRAAPKKSPDEALLRQGDFGLRVVRCR